MLPIPHRHPVFLTAWVKPFPNRHILKISFPHILIVLFLLGKGGKFTPRKSPDIPLPLVSRKGFFPPHIMYKERFVFKAVTEMGRQKFNYITLRLNRAIQHPIFQFGKADQSL